MKFRLAISYIRWSSPPQSLGDSKRRQLESTEKFCEQNNLVLDKKLVDPQLSAFKGKHRKPGSKLARLLEEIKGGKIAPGTVLIVESLDRLTRQAIPVALEMFLGIIRAGVEIVTLIDGQWYTSKNISDIQNLLVSIIALWRAHEDSRLKGKRVGAAWQKKRSAAVADSTPMSPICPGWLKLSEDKGKYEAIPDRVKLVKFIFWLTLRGWSRRRIANLLNKHNVDPWGVGKKRANGWHVSYIAKILSNRAVLGEFVPHTTRSQNEDGSEAELDGVRRPTDPAIKGYFPRVVADAMFNRVQALRPGPRGPTGRHVSNLFQGLVKDGDFPKFSMCYRDHGKADWQYLVSDHRRKNPDEPIFSWQYNKFEAQVLNYIQDLDWSALTVETDVQVRRHKDDLKGMDAELARMDREVRRLVQLGKEAGGVAEVATELKKLGEDRDVLRKKAAGVRAEIQAKSNLSAEAGLDLIKQLAADRSGIESRLRLRTELRNWISTIELFRTIPSRLFQGTKLPKEIQKGVKLRDLMSGRCIRIAFSNGAERWLLERQRDGVMRFDGHSLPSGALVTNKDSFSNADGSQLVSMKFDHKSPPVALENWKKKRNKAVKSAH